MKITVHHISEFFETWAPFKSQAEYDNSGLLIGSENQPISGILTCLDITEDVVSEAISLKANLIVAHHPLIFNKISRINPDSDQGSLIYRLISNNIAVLAVHTNLDAAQNGVSFVLARTLGLSHTEILSYHDAENRHGYGVIGELPEATSAEAFLDRVCTSLKTVSVRFSGKSDSIQRVAVCGGTGISLASEARKRGAQAYVTADIKYHEYFGYSDLLLVDAGHYETEFPVADHLRKELSEKFPELPVFVTQSVTNPMRVHVNQSFFNKHLKS